jgi:carbon monoxide dehydrogenase subunit G
VTTIRATVTVPAPLEDVFAFLDDPPSQVAATPSLAAVENVEPLPGGGKRLDYRYELLGVGLEGTMVTATYDPPRRITWAVSGAVEGEIDWRLEPAGDDGGDGDDEGPRTRFTYVADYDLSLPVVGAALNPVLAPVTRWYNVRELRRTLRNVRAAVA